MGWGLALLAVTLGCATPYKGITKPTPSLRGVSGDLQSLSDTAIETYLKADVRPAFPTMLAVAKVADAREGTRDGWTSPVWVEGVWGAEGDGWWQLAESGSPTAALIEQVQTVRGLIVRPPARARSRRVRPCRRSRRTCGSCCWTSRNARRRPGPRICRTEGGRARERDARTAAGWQRAATRKELRD